jgi:phytoene dehydrogenase-like protein
VIVVGAGLAGLGCAVHLESRGISTLLLERSDTVGGRVRTDVVDGFRLDRGFQVLLTAYPEAESILDYGALRLRSFFPGALIRSGGRFRRLADPWRAPVAAVLGVLNGAVPPADALRIARFRRRVMSTAEAAASNRTFQSSAERLAAEGFSQRTMQRFFQPFFGGVFLDPELTTSERQLEFVFRMFASGSIAVPSLGMAEIPAQLAARLPAGSIRTRSSVAAADGTGVTLADGQRIEPDAVVLAVDGSEAHRMGWLPDAPTWRATTCLYFAAGTPPTRGPLLVLNGEGRGPINNMCVASEVSPEYAPRDRSLVSVTVVGDHRSEDSLTTRVRNQLVEWYGDDANRWRHVGSYAVPRALPAFEEPTTPNRSPRVSDRLFICGDHWADPSINGALASGRRAADAVAADLEESAR